MIFNSATEIVLRSVIKTKWDEFKKYHQYENGYKKYIKKINII